MLQHPKHGMIMTVNLQLQVEYPSQIQKLLMLQLTHTTGAETMAGVKTFTNGVTIPGGTLTVTNATITGANSDSILDVTNLYYTNPRARAAISVTDNSSAGNELQYNSPTGVISWNGTTAGASGSNTQNTI